MDRPRQEPGIDYRFAARNSAGGKFVGARAFAALASSGRNAMSTAITSVWKVGPQRLLSLDRPRIIGVVNVTPDSFSDGGMFKSVAAAVDYAMNLVMQGASVIDIGGESTRPGSRPVPTAEQIHR